jgi:hypothetical protein
MRAGAGTRWGMFPMCTLKNLMWTSIWHQRSIQDQKESIAVLKKHTGSKNVICGSREIGIMEPHHLTLLVIDTQKNR